MSHVPAYQGFSSIYDMLMEDAPYEQWLAYLEHWLQQYPIHNRGIVDLGCGTGKLAAMVAKKGYTIYGVDVSEDMLSVAHKRFTDEGVSSFFLIHQDMRELQLPGTFGLMYSFCDCLNYITDEEEVIQVFKQVHKHLDADGFFLFDMHSPYKITEVYGNGPIADDDLDVSYIWIPVVDEQRFMVEHHIHFFVREQMDLYRRFSEVHVQRAYTIDTIKTMLHQADFELLSITADFTDDEPNEQSERLFFAARARK